MKKKLLVAFGVLLIFILGGTLLINQPSKTEKLRKKYGEFLKNSPYQKTLKLSKKERLAKGIPPNKYYEQQYLLEMNPKLGRPTPEKLFKLQEQLNNSAKTSRVPGDATDNKWVERGPNNVGGRTRVVVYDPNDTTHKRVFAGGVSGGLWVTQDITDPTVSWTRVGIPENLAVSCMTIDPNNPQNMYVGTGESYTNANVTGDGIWKSTNGGNSWSKIYDTNNTLNTAAADKLFFVNDIIAWNNSGTTVLFAGVGSAYYPYSFGGSDPNAFPGYHTTGLYTDGTNFTLKYTITNGQRTQIAVSGINPNTIFALASMSTSSAPVKMIKTSDAFATTPTTLALPSDADTSVPANDFTRGQAFYDLTLEVDPTNDAILYAGGIDIFRSANGGTNWPQITRWSKNNALANLNVSIVHSDQHAITFNPANPNKAVIGCDGGVYYAPDLATAFMSNSIIERNKDYNVTQFYKGAIGQDATPTNEIFLAGAQDNGSQFIKGLTADVNLGQDLYGGDGAYEFIDKDGAYMIVSYVYNTYTRIDLPYIGSGTISASIVADQNSGQFINPAVLDDNLDILYTDGSTSATNQFFRFTGITTTSSATKTSLTNALLTGKPTAFKVSPYTTGSSTLFIGTMDGKLLKVTYADQTAPFLRKWTDITGSSFVGSISAVNLGANENEIMVTFYNYGVTSIFYTADGGTTWVSKEGDFPDIPIQDIMMNPLNPDEVILATDLGVWRTQNFSNTSPSWVQSQNGMSNVKVTSFAYRTADNTDLDENL